MLRARYCLAISLVLALLVFGSAYAASVQEFVLDNGLKILLAEDHKSPSVTFQIWYRVGGRNEKDGKSGLAHFLEHMMFKGTPTTGPEEYSRIIAKNGGRSNAFTSNDMTVYFATMSREKIGIEIDLEADRMANALLGETYFEPEKKVIQEERRLRTDDNPAAALSEVASAVAFVIHPYRRPVVGWMEDIQNLTRQDLADFYKLYYAPNNAVIVIVGDFSIAEILPKVKAAFEKIPRGAPPPVVDVVEPEQRGERRVTLKKEAELASLLMFYQAPNLKSPDNFALDLLAVVLAGGRSSRLHHELVYQKRLVRGVDADYSSVSVDPMGFSISAQLLPGVQPAMVESEIDGMLVKVKAELISERELQKAKNQIEAAFVFAQDSIFGQAMKIGYYEIAGGWRQMDSYLDGIRKVTREDIRRVARQYLNADRRTLGTLIPTKEKAQ
ncbi:MAG TPA: pitrilysin family protein [Candidatus Saccharimonadales bacterium]|nr:pitrilysin family protein [Candidatus Saccharimonadales bacterium]